MTINMILMIIVILFIASVLAAGIYFYLRDKTLAEIRTDVYQLFLKAEHNPNFTKKGKQKMKWVLSQARMLLPGWAQFLISDAFLENVVEAWFRAVKDLLDDGKYNKSVKEE